MSQICGLRLVSTRVLPRLHPQLITGLGLIVTLCRTEGREGRGSRDDRWHDHRRRPRGAGPQI